MRHLLILVLFCSLLFGCEPLSLKGTIINEQNEPIPNATITLKRTNKSVTTNDKGQFTISNLHFDDTLIISAAGYIPETENYDYSLQGYELTIRLKRKISMLDGTVGIGNSFQQLNVSTLQAFQKFQTIQLSPGLSHDRLFHLPGGVGLVRKVRVAIFYLT